MPRILTVDDSLTIRSLIARQMTELGHEVEHAEDGQQALTKLETMTVDLILLDVTMPVMDGPTMLGKLRQTGNRTPVIMLTSESKRTIVSGAVKLGIEDYILKPFKPEELRAKVGKVLRTEVAKSAADAPVEPSPNASPGESVAAAKTASHDILVIDDMENVHKKLRALLPEAISLDGATSAKDALALAQERAYKVVLIDMVMPDVNSIALMNQLRRIAPRAAMVALALRTANDLASEVKAAGFDDFVFKPFAADALDDLVAKHFDSNDLVAVEANAITCGGYGGKEDRVERYFTRMKAMCRDALEEIASACYEDAILDIAAVPAHGDRAVRFVIDVDKEAKRLGIALRLVGGSDVRKTMGSVVDTASMPFFDSVGEARSAA